MSQVPSPEGLRAHILDGIDAIAALHERAKLDQSMHQRRVESLSLLLARPAAVYVVLVGSAMWVAGNVAAGELGIHAIDPPPFYAMQCLVCVFALIAALVVASAQRRQGLLAEQRAHLDLQVNLLAEKKLAKLIALVEELRRDSPQIKNRVDQEAEEMSTPADPAIVAQALDDELNRTT